MREISHYENMPADEALKLLPTEGQKIVHKIRLEKQAGARPKPSVSLVDRSFVLTETRRHAILDKVAELVDENLVGRSDMCRQFAELLSRALKHLGLSARAVRGTAIYYDKKDQNIFDWDHAWVRIGEEVIDGNVDILFENPTVPSSVKVAPYWGPVKETPTDRKLREDRGVELSLDSDVDDIWWPELRTWLDQTQ